MEISKLYLSSAGVNVVDEFGAAVGALVSGWYGALVCTLLVIYDVGTAGDAVDPFDGISFGGAKGACAGMKRACAGVNVGVNVGKDDTNDGMVIGN
jgi:hypothetical protein